MGSDTQLAWVLLGQGDSFRFVIKVGHHVSACMSTGHVQQLRFATQTDTDVIRTVYDELSYAVPVLL